MAPLTQPLVSGEGRNPGQYSKTEHVVAAL